MSKTDKTIDTMLKSILQEVDYDVCKAWFWDGWDGDPEDREVSLEVIRGVVSKHLPKIAAAALKDAQ